MVGKTVSHYHILEEIGRGGMGTVYKAEDTKLKRTVALKFLPPELTRDPDAKERFIREAQAASALEHNNICNIHEIGESDDGQLFIVMACYEGKTLRDKLSNIPLSPPSKGETGVLSLQMEEAIGIAIQISEGLAKAHEKGIVHRDIKPANILITDDGVVKILDFGLAKLAGQVQLTKDSSTLGTVAYMSPEQLSGNEVDQRTDIWSLGVVLYEMISGKKPFDGDYEQAIVYSIINEKHDALSALRTVDEQELGRIINKALDKDVNERYQHMDEFLVDLKRFNKDVTSSAQIKPVESARGASANKWIKKLAIGSLVILFITIILFFARMLVFKEMPFGEPKPVVVISFNNQTGDTTYNYLQEAIPNLLITSLEQSKYLRVITWERMYDLLKQLGRENVNIIDKELGFELCRLEGVEAIILGSFVKAGDVFATDVKVLDVRSKRLLNSASSKGEGVGSILQNQIDDLSKAISKSIGISEQTLRGTQMRISKITTPSMNAYNYFIRGREDYDRMYYVEARKFLQKAIELDSTFAVAYLYLAWSNHYLGYYDDRDYYYQKAKIYSKTAAAKDRLYIEAYYARRVEKDPEKRIKILKQMVNMYPNEKRIYYDLAEYYDSRNMYDEALAQYNKALELDPNYGPAHNGLAYIYGDLGNFEKANEHLTKYTSSLPGDANPFDSMAELYLRTGRIDEAILKYEEAIEAKPGFGSELKLSFIYAIIQDFTKAVYWTDRFIENAPSIGSKGRGYWVRGLRDYWSGDIKQSLIDLQKSVELGESVGYELVIAMTNWVKAWIFLDLGKFRQSEELYNNYFNYLKKDSPRYLTNNKLDRAFFQGIMYLRKSQIDSTKLKLREIDGLIPTLTPNGKIRAQRHYDLLYANILLSQDSLDKAIDKYKNISPMDIPFAFEWNFMTVNFPYEKDGLAKAYIRKGETDKAIMTYERMIILDKDSKNWLIIHPIYHYRLAKLYEEKGRKTEAIEKYKEFIKIWKNPDKNSPELIDAKVRLAKLMNN